MEAVINQHPAVADVAVIGVPDPMRDEAIKACIILQEGRTATADDIIAFCAERLSKFRVPEFVEFRSEFPAPPLVKSRSTSSAGNRRRTGRGGGGNCQHQDLRDWTMGRMVDPINPIHPLIRRILMLTKEEGPG